MKHMIFLQDTMPKVTWFATLFFLLQAAFLGIIWKASPALGHGNELNILKLISIHNKFQIPWYL